MQVNSKIRRMAKANGVPFWKISDKLKISQPTFTRPMCKPFSKEKEAQLMEIIIRLKDDD